MATLRLFANLREIAGTSRIEFEASSVGDALDQAAGHFGDQFSTGLASAKLWVNGEQADRSTQVSTNDEIAVIPPVSGGAAILEEATDITRAVLSGSLWITVAVANLISAEALTFAAVGTTIAWLWDVSDTYAGRRPSVQVIPAMMAGTVGATGAYGWGLPGLAGGLAIAVMLTLAWAIFDKRNRAVDALAVSTLLAATAALGAGSLVIVRLRSVTEVSAFLFVAGLAAVAAWIGRRFGGASADPNLAILVIALAAGAATGVVADSLDLIVMLLASAVTAGGLIAGRALGSLLRTGDVLHTVRSPGVLTMLDPAVIGVSLWWASLLLFSAVTAPA